MLNKKVDRCEMYGIAGPGLALFKNLHMEI